ncbi:MAG TPA: PTS glucose/sucrose transporter subunit IIB [Propionicimonas sp.]|nr:PTS glucose/sucrose transporter subunit IIB [Propionicimonas sp.]
MSDDEQVARRILELAGGRANVLDCDLCFTRLRLMLADPGVVDVPAIEAMPEVTMTFTQSGQFQIVLTGGVRAVHAAMRALLTEGRDGAPHDGAPRESSRGRHRRDPR